VFFFGENWIRFAGTEQTFFTGFFKEALDITVINQQRQ
jgi:hypothetical protein